jgi:hypothetical protein
MATLCKAYAVDDVHQQRTEEGSDDLGADVARDLAHDLTTHDVLVARGETADLDVEQRGRTVEETG